MGGLPHGWGAWEYKKKKKKKHHLMNRTLSKDKTKNLKGLYFVIFCQAKKVIFIQVFGIIPL